MLLRGSPFPDGQDPAPLTSAAVRRSNATIDAVSQACSLEREYVASVMDKLIEEGVVVRKAEKVSRNRTIKVLEVDRKAAKKCGYKTEE